MIKLIFLNNHKQYHREKGPAFFMDIGKKYHFYYKNGKFINTKNKFE